MILSNHTSRPDLDRKSIMQLGDTLGRVELNMSIKLNLGLSVETKYESFS